MSGYGESSGRGSRGGAGGFSHDYQRLDSDPGGAGGGGYGGSRGGYGGGGYGGGYNDDDRAGLIDDHNRQERDGFMEQQYDDFGNIIRQRDEAVEEIENTMLEVNEIYRDLAQLVDEQGEHLDNIENNMTLTDERVEGGAAHLVKASKYQKQARKKSLWCLGIALAVLAVVFVLAFGVPWNKKKGGGGGSSPAVATTPAPPAPAPAPATTAPSTSLATTTTKPPDTTTAAPIPSTPAPTSQRMVRRALKPGMTNWRITDKIANLHRRAIAGG